MKKFTLIMTACLMAMLLQAGTVKSLAHVQKLQQLKAQSTQLNAAEGETPVTPPEGAEPQIYKFVGFDTYINKNKESEVFIITEGSDIYIQGLSLDYLPSGWVKGTMADNVATFPAAYMGSFDFWGDTYELYFDGAIFTYDAASNTFTSADGYTTTAEETVLDEYSDVTLTGVVATPATPAMPEITEFTQDDYGYYVKMTIPVVDENGNELMGSLLSYQMYYEDADGVHEYQFTQDNYVFIEQDMTQVPYNYTDSYDIDKAGKQVYLYSDNIKSWLAVGVKSIYTVGDDARESEIYWFEIPVETAVTDISTAATISVRYLDMQGREVGNDATGLLIKQMRLADGSTQSIKVLK